MAQSMEHSPEQRQAIVDRICDEMIGKKRSLYRVLADNEELPSYSLVKKWQRLSGELRDQIAQAREEALEALIEDMIEISQAKDIDHNEKRVRLIAIEKAAQMLAPRRFAMRHTDITTGGDKLPSAQTATAMDRIDALIALALQRRANSTPMLSPPIIEGEIVTLDDVMD